MFLIEILLPLQEERGEPFPAESYDRLAQRLMRWTTYNRLMERLRAADRVADARLVMLAARWTGR